jgi:hypothetical protein
MTFRADARCQPMASPTSATQLRVANFPGAERWPCQPPAGLHNPGAAPYPGRVSELPVEDIPGLAGPAHKAADGDQVVYLTEHGQRLAAIIPASAVEKLRRLQDAEDERMVRAALASESPGRTFATAEEMLRAAGLA